MGGHRTWLRFGSGSLSAPQTRREPPPTFSANWRRIAAVERGYLLPQRPACLTYRLISPAYSLAAAYRLFSRSRLYPRHLYQRTHPILPDPIRVAITLERRVASCSGP